MKYGACNLHACSILGILRKYQSLTISEVIMDLRNAKEFDEYSPCQLGMYNIIYNYNK